MKAFLVATVLGYLAVCCHSQCSDGVTNTWTDAEYQTSSSSLDDPNGTPVGFRRLDYPGTDDQDPRFPCVAVSFPNGATGIRYFYVLIATRSTVCLRIDGESQSTCLDGEFSICRTNVASNLNVEFDECTGSCDQNEFSFQYRVILELRDADDEFFCSNLNETYPSSLQVLPTNAVTVDPNPSQNPDNGSAVVSPFILSSLLLISLIALLFTR